MSISIKEETGMDLSEYIGESIYLRTGRSNNVIIDDKRSACSLYTTSTKDPYSSTCPYGSLVLTCYKK